jgi:hypothetical protein
MSITTTINNIAFTFELDADECWNIYAEHNFIEYVARDAKFTPLKTSTAAQIQELLKYDGQWEWFVAKNDKGVESRNIMLWWFVPLLDMKIIVQLEKKQTSVAEDVEVRFKMQEKQIAELQAEHKTELTKLRDEHSATVKKLVKDFSARFKKQEDLMTELYTKKIREIQNKYQTALIDIREASDTVSMRVDSVLKNITKLQSQFDRMALHNKRMVIHFEMQGDKLKLSYEDKYPEATRAYNAYIRFITKSLRAQLCHIDTIGSDADIYEYCRYLNKHNNPHDGDFKCFLYNEMVYHAFNAKVLHTFRQPSNGLAIDLSIGINYHKYDFYYSSENEGFTSATRWGFETNIYPHIPTQYNAINLTTSGIYLASPTETPPYVLTSGIQLPAGLVDTIHMKSKKKLYMKLIFRLYKNTYLLIYNSRIMDE